MQLCVVAMKIHAKFEEELPHHFKSWQISTQALDNLKNLHFNGLLLTKVYVWTKKKYSGVIFDRTEDWCKIWRKTDLKNLANFHLQTENSDFILESKMAELNQNQNSKQTDRPDTVWKLYFTFKINE